MKTFKQFIKEDTQKTTITSQEELLKYLNTYCSDFATPWKNGKRICRGSDGLGNAVNAKGTKGIVIDVSQTSRKSVNGRNYYTVFFDYLFSTKYKNFPLRSKSLIATSNFEKAVAFGRVSWLIPSNSCAIGVIDKSDIWSVEGSFAGRTLWVTEINELLQKLGIGETIDDIKKGSEQYKKMSLDDMKHKVDPTNFNNYKDILKSGLYDELTKYYTQIINNHFNAETPSTYSPGNRNEVWVGNGPSVAISETTMKKLKVKSGKWTF